MKFLAAALSLALAVSASPVPQVNEGPEAVYNLQISSTNEELNKQFLSVEGESVGVHNGKDAVAFTFSGSATKSQMNLYPSGIVAHSIGLKGPENALKELSDISHPPGTTFPIGVIADWDNFVRTDKPSAETTPGDAAKGTVKYTGAGGWTAFPKGNGSWRLLWNDGSMITTANGFAVELNYVPQMHIMTESSA